MPVFTFSNPSPGLKLSMCALVGSAHRHDETWHQHPEEWVIDYSHEPGALCRTEFSKWRRRGDRMCHIYPPGRRYADCFENSVSISFVIFSGECEILRKLTANPDGFAQVYDPEAIIGTLLTEIFHTASTAGESGYWQSSSKLLLLLDELSRLEPDPQSSCYTFTSHTRSSPPLGTIVLDYLKRNYFRHITVDALARHFSMSRSVLMHRFREETGESLIGALTRIRIEQSLPELLHGELLKNVAAHAGFGSEYYYSRIFAQRMGMPPSEWRRQASRRARGES